MNEEGRSECDTVPGFPVMELRWNLSLMTEEGYCCKCDTTLGLPSSNGTSKASPPLICSAGVIHRSMVAEYFCQKVKVIAIDAHYEVREGIKKIDFFRKKS